MKYDIGDQVIDEDGCRGYICIRYEDGDLCFWENDAAHPNPVIVDSILDRNNLDTSIKNPLHLPGPHGE